MVALASRAAERMFFAEDNSAGVSSDLFKATSLVARMLGGVGMLDRISVGENSGPRGGDRFDKNVEEKLQSLYQQVWNLLDQNRWFLLAIAHALQAYKTIAGEDIEAIYFGRQGPTLDGAVYRTPEFVRFYGEYHEAALVAHQKQGRLEAPLPIFQVAGTNVGPVYVSAGPSPWAPPGLPPAPPVPAGPYRQVIEVNVSRD
jgi:hypothetical protein